MMRNTPRSEAKKIKINLYLLEFKSIFVPVYCVCVSIFDRCTDGWTDMEVVEDSVYESVCVCK